MRQLAPEVLLTAKTQRWAPEEVLRTLIEAEIASRDASNTRARLKAAAFPVVKTIEEFDLSASSIPTPTFAYLASLEWIGAKKNLPLIGPAGTGKSHTLIALGHAAVPWISADTVVEELPIAFWTYFRSVRRARPGWRRSGEGHGGWDRQGRGRRGLP
jgi:IstB-like ATP binding protein